MEDRSRRETEHLFIISQQCFFDFRANQSQKEKILSHRISRQPDTDQSDLKNREQNQSIVEGYIRVP